MVTVYLIRHGEAEGNLYRRMQGQYNGDLTDLGRRQIGALGRRFQNVRLDAVYSSDLSRAMETGAVLCRPRGLPLRTDPRLREVCVGPWEDLPFGNAAADQPAQFQQFIRDPNLDYHAELLASGEARAEEMKRLLEGFGIPCRITHRKGTPVVYMKEAEAISDFLSVVGASRSRLEWENVRIIRSIQGEVNRRVNCEAANIGKTVSASRKQINDILFLEKAGILRTLPESLRKMAELRMQYPDTPLRELGDLAVPPIGKSGVNHRLRRLTEIAQKYRMDSGNTDNDPGAGNQKRSDSAVKESVE